MNQQIVYHRQKKTDELNAMQRRWTRSREKVEIVEERGQYSSQESTPGQCCFDTTERWKKWKDQHNEQQSPVGQSTTIMNDGPK